jgi:tetratricopeptide (TPR) repeat protein
MRAGQPGQALKELEGAIAMEPEDATGHDYRAWALHEMRRHKDALLSAQEAVRLEPTDPNGLRTLCNMQLAAHEVSAADDTATRLRSLEPNSAKTFNCIGLVRMAQRKPKEAAESFRAGLTLEPQNQGLINNLGLALVRMRKVGDGLGVLGQAVRADPRSGVARSNLFLMSQLYLGWFSVLMIFLANTATQAIFFHRFSLPGMAFGFLFTTFIILIFRYYKLMRMDRDLRRVHLAEVRRARRSVLPLVLGGLLVVLVLVGASYFEGWLDPIGAGASVAAAISVAIMFGVVLPWPVEYLPWARR